MNIKDIEKIIRLVEDSSLDNLEIKDDGFEIKLNKSKNINVINENITSVVQGTPTNNNVVIESNDNCVVETLNAPLVGTFYSKPSPDAKSFVSVGQEVVAGDVICIIEAMKVMNEIKASVSGKISKLLIEDGSMVEFDQPLYELG